MEFRKRKYMPNKAVLKLSLLFCIAICLIYKIGKKIFIAYVDPAEDKYNYFKWVYYFMNHEKIFIFNFYLFYIFIISAFFSLILWYKIYKDDIDE